MRIRLFLLMVLSALAQLFSATVSATELGQLAPPLKVEKWVKGSGKNIVLAKGTNVVVLIFWETWCDSCMTAMPQIIALENQMKSKGMLFAGISIELATNISSFLESNEAGKKIDFPVAADPQRESYEFYMTGFGQTVFPHAFVVRDGIISWHGHPLAGLGWALQTMLNGTFDINEEKKIDAASRLQKRYFDFAKSPTNTTQAAEIGRRIVHDGAKNPWLLNNFAWKIMKNADLKNRDLNLALQASQLASDAAKTNTAFVDTYARALFVLGRKAEAIAAQKRAVSLAQDEGNRFNLQETLKTYEESMPNSGK